MVTPITIHATTSSFVALLVCCYTISRILVTQYEKKRKKQSLLGKRTELNDNELGLLQRASVIEKRMLVFARRTTAAREMRKENSTLLLKRTKSS